MMDENMLRMQQEAVERVRQMQERARRYVENDPITLSAPSDPLPASADPDPPLPASPRAREPKGALSLLDGFGEDKDQLLLLMLAVLLVKNNAPIELILALLYIAM